MKIVIRLFAGLREGAGVSRLSLELPPGATIAIAKAALLREYPQLTGSMSKTLFAVNRTCCELDVSLKDGDELAFLPPVSGG